MPGSHKQLMAALDVAMSLSAEEQLRLRDILSLAPELIESARYMREAPPILRPTVEKMRRGLVTRLAGEWDMGEQHVSEVIDRFTAPTPDAALDPTDALQRGVRVPGSAERQP